MNRARFLATRQPDWYRFRDLLARAESTRLKNLSGMELSDLSRLFRALCYDLAVVRSRDWGGELEGRLNDLVVRGHNILYQAPPGRPRAVLDFLLSGFPRLLRGNAGYFWVALALFVVPGLIAGTLIALEPALANRILPGPMLAQMEAMHSTDHGTRALFSGGEAAKFGFYVFNNVSIAFKAFALGMLLGIGTMLLLVYNSIVLGAVTGFLIARGHAETFFSFVIGHGSFELTAIVVAGAAGLVLGRAIVHPGQYSRMDALQRRGLVAVKLVLGAGAMLTVAALIEGAWSPMGLPFSVKLPVGIALWLLVVVYLTLGGRWTRGQDVAPLDAAQGDLPPGEGTGRP